MIGTPRLGLAARGGWPIRLVLAGVGTRLVSGGGWGLEHSSRVTQAVSPLGARMVLAELDGKQARAIASSADGPLIGDFRVLSHREAFRTVGPFLGSVRGGSSRLRRFLLQLLRVLQVNQRNKRNTNLPKRI